jgi:two-component system, OmpR family, phosphate regulon sensor histidine kinase PhoR
MSESDEAASATRRVSARSLIILSLAGAAAPLVLWTMGGARLLPALIASAIIILVGAVVYRFTPRDRRPVLPAVASPPSGPPAAPDRGRAPPFAAILEHLADPVLLVTGADPQDFNARRFVFANAAARELLRLQRQEGPLTMAIRAPEVLSAVDDALFASVTGQALYQSGGVQDRVWRVNAAPLEGLGGERLALLCLRDETEFRRSERTRADFLANASHELRTPLASLAGFIETLRGHAKDDAVARERFLAIMQIQADRMRRLIDDLMSLSRIELGEHIPPSGEVDVALAAIDVLDALGPIADERSVSFAPDLPSLGNAVVPGDRDQILQVIQNLTENALKYSPDGNAVRVEVMTGLDSASASAPVSKGTTHLSLLTPDHVTDVRYVALRVRDQGPGIARAYLPRLTERFYRVEGQKSGEHAGTGLGLAIVKHIINRHRGGMTVESAEGRGSTFTVYVPMARPTGTPPA